MEANLDRGEIITKQSSDELLGDTLLQAEYSISNEQKLKSRSGFKIMNESIVLDRPITPSHLRQSVMLQTKPFNPSDISHLDINQTGLFKNSKSTNSRLQGWVHSQTAILVKCQAASQQIFLWLIRLRRSSRTMLMFIRNQKLLRQRVYLQRLVIQTVDSRVGQKSSVHLTKVWL